MNAAADARDDMPVMPNWHIVLGPDGSVLTVWGTAPTHWVGAQLADCQDAPAELQEAGRALLSEMHESRRPFVLKTLRLRLTHQTVDLLAVEAIPLRRLATELASLLRATTEMMRPQAQKMDIKLEAVISDELPDAISLDADKVAWAVATLVGNAIRHAHPGSLFRLGGTVVVSASYHAAVSEVIIEVADDGTGIPAEKLPLLFRRHPDQPPVGVALILVHDVVVAHGGRVEVTSNNDSVEHGTRIRLIFPMR